MDVALAQYDRRVLSLAYLPRDGKIRVISFRPASWEERRDYMATIKKTNSVSGLVQDADGYWERVAEAVAKQDAEEDEYIPWNPEDELYDPNDDQAVEAFFNASEAFHGELRAAGIRLDDYEAIQRFKELREPAGNDQEAGKH